MVIENAPNPFVVTKIHNYRPMAIEFSWWHQMAIEFSDHAIMAVEKKSIATHMWQPKGF
jgi:hypothetical protein